MLRSRRPARPARGTLRNPSPLWRGLAAYFPFNEGGGAPVEYFSRAKVSLTGTTSWGPAASPYMGTSFQGDGTSGFGTISLPAINSWSNLSVAMLWSCPSGQPTSGRVVEKGANSEWQVTCFTNAGNQMLVGVGDANCQTPAAVFDGKWHHIAFTWGGTAGVVSGPLKLYVDGVSVASNSSSVTSGTGTLSIYQYGGGGFHTASKLAGLWIWQNRILSAAEVRSHSRDPGQLFGPQAGAGLWGSAATATLSRRTLYARAGSRGIQGIR